MFPALLLVALVVLAVAVWPRWGWYDDPATPRRGPRPSWHYAPSGVLFVFFVVLTVLWASGRLPDLP